MDQQGKPDGRKVQSVPHTVQGAEAQLPPVLSRLPKWARIWWVWAFIGCLLAAGGWYGWQDRPSSNDLFAEA